MTRLSYARVLVEIDLRKTLRESVNLCLPNGEKIEQQIVYETLPKFCSHCKVIGHLVETCTKYAKKSNVSAANGAANANGKGLQQRANNVQVLGRQQGIPNDVLPTKDDNVDAWQPKLRDGVAGKGTTIAPVSGAAAKAESSVAAKALSGVTGMGADIAPVSGAAARLAISVAAKAASGMLDVGAEITPMGVVAGLGAGIAPVSGAAARGCEWRGRQGIKQRVYAWHVRQGC
ncbi:hypothetical protein OIU76_000493 [Salix suchowensis]|nr:hypothetical protein OIU76_000493 [Salix suchowensis]